MAETARGQKPVIVPWYHLPSAHAFCYVNYHVTSWLHALYQYGSSADFANHTPLIIE